MSRNVIERDHAIDSRLINHERRARPRIVIALGAALCIIAPFLASSDDAGNFQDDALLLCRDIDVLGVRLQHRTLTAAGYR